MSSGWTGDFLAHNRKAAATSAVAHREPPHSLEAEQGALSSMMIDRNALSECVDRMTTEYFYVPAHQTIFAAIAQIYRDNKVIDLITFTQFLRDENLLDSVGGAAYVTQLFLFVPTAANVLYYFDIIRDKFLARQIISKCTELVRVAYDDTNEIAAVLEQTQSTLTEIIMESERPDVFQHIKEGVLVALDNLEQAYHNRGKQAVRGLATGIIDFDRMTGGLRGQQLVILGARPSQGKTAMAMNFAVNMAVKNKVPVGVFSMEMSFTEISERVLSQVAGVNLQRFRDGMLSKWETICDDLIQKTGTITAAPMWIDETPALSISSFKARARLMKMRFGVKAIFVDYLQLMRSPTRRAEEARWLEITEISGTLKAVAKELNVPVICCAQLNREAEQREFGKPKLADLRESGSIEQDADIVAMLWRPDRHINDPSKDLKKLARMLRLTDDDGTDLARDDKDMQEHEIKLRNSMISEFAGLLVVKHRNGPVTNAKNHPNGIRLRFIGEETRFENLTEKSWSNNPNQRQQE